MEISLCFNNDDFTMEQLIVEHKKLLPKGFQKFILELDQSIFDYGLQAYEELKNGVFTSFDPLVGEWGCQLRGWLYAFIFSLKSSEIERRIIYLLGFSKLLTNCCTYLEIKEIGLKCP